MIEKLPIIADGDWECGDIILNRKKLNELVDGYNRIEKWIDFWEQYDSGWNKEK